MEKRAAYREAKKRRRKHEEYIHDYEKEVQESVGRKVL
jgi:hypothetical protein